MAFLAQCYEQQVSDLFDHLTGFQNGGFGVFGRHDNPPGINGMSNLVKIIGNAGAAKFPHKLSEQYFIVQRFGFTAPAG